MEMLVVLEVLQDLEEQLIIDNINKTGKLEEKTEKKLTSIIEEFKKNK